jgi:Calcineurin-like phosphoesterase
MKILILAFFPVLLLGFLFPDKEVMYCGNNKISNDSPNKKLLEEQYDGPYVQYKMDKVFAKYILLNNGTKMVKVDSVALSQKDNLSLKVRTDEPDKFFTVQLKQQLQNEKSEYANVNKQLVLSDIEGNFGAFRKLLQGNGVIDAGFNWVFGDGHLVLIGDFFDRGQQVTEVLWLIYYLEEKAKAAGGYVHFILGNHEIMNLSGDLRYVQQKYKDNATLLNEKYESLYDENTELGRWLRTKNIVEKIGSILYMHGGISGEVNRMNLSTSAIDQLARPYYADTTNKSPDPKIDIILTDQGPFWYRGYYTGIKAAPQQIDSTLSVFGVNHIVTGHTIVADTVSVWYNGKVMNTDVHHAAGKSEALLIEGDSYYRVNAEGKKLLLLKD